MIKQQPRMHASAGEDSVTWSAASALRVVATELLAQLRGRAAVALLRRDEFVIFAGDIDPAARSKHSFSGPSRDRPRKIMVGVVYAMIVARQEALPVEPGWLRARTASTTST